MQTTTSIRNATRRLIVLGLLATMAGCAIPEAPSEDVGPPSPKTTAELLVGKWKWLRDEPGTPEGFEAYLEFTADGKVTMTMTTPTERRIPQPEVQNGTYHLEGRTLLLAMGGEDGDRKVTIDSITEDRFVDSDWVGNELQVHVCERVKR